jgi:L-alanine-DL-glutamate epimerase-like enolase superfamily enzyme
MGTYAESSFGALAALGYAASQKSLQQIPAENSFFLKLQKDCIEPLTIDSGQVKLPSSPGLGAEPSQLF